MLKNKEKQGIFEEKEGILKNQDKKNELDNCIQFFDQVDQGSNRQTRADEKRAGFEL